MADTVRGSRVRKNRDALVSLSLSLLFSHAANGDERDDRSLRSTPRYDVTRVEILPDRNRMRDARRSKAPPGDCLCLIHAVSTPTMTVV